MKKIIAPLIVMLLVFTSNITAQPVKVIPVVTLSTADTLSGSVIKNYDRMLTGTYYYSVSVFYDHLSGTTDTCLCNLQESVDGTHYLTVSGSTTALFKASDDTFIWTGGTGNLPLIWPSNYLRVSCSHKQTGTGRPYIKLQLKNEN